MHVVICIFDFMKFVLFLIKFIVFKPIIRPAIGHGLRFYRAMLYIRGTSHEPVSVRLSVCPSQVGVLSKRLNESSWVLACELPSTRPTLC